MNDDRKFQDVKEFLIYLLVLKMPNYIIERILEISGATLAKYKKKVLGTVDAKEWDGTTMKKGEELPQLLKVYADKINYPNKLSSFDKKLLPVLKETLRIQDVEEMLKSSMRAYVPLMYPSCNNDVLDEYQQIVEDMVNLQTKSLKLEDAMHLEAIDVANKMLSNYIQDIRMDAIELPKQHELHVGATGHFVNKLLKAKVDEMRKAQLAPVFTEEIVQHINDAINTLPSRQANLVILHYGLMKDDGMKLSKVADELDVTWRKAKDLQFSALTSIRTYLLTNANFGLNISKAWQVVQEKDAQIRDLEEKIPVGIQADVIISDANFDVLIMKVDHCGFTSRVRNFLIGGGIDYIWELTELTELQISKFRNLGSKSLHEIKEFFAENKLNFGTRYTGETIEKFKRII